MQLSPVLRALLGPCQEQGIPEASQAWLQKKTDISYGEKGKSQSCCLVLPETGAKPASRQISVGARVLAGCGLEGQLRTLWPCGQLGWRLFSPS